MNGTTQTDISLNDPFCPALTGWAFLCPLLEDAMAAYAPINWLGEAELIPFDPPVDPTLDDVPNLAAFLNMLAHAEGTDRFGDQGGYNVLVGGGLFYSYADHPRQRVWLPKYKIHSTAAGRPQFLVGTWDDLVARFGFKDFSPASQDAGATQLIRQCKALQLIYDGRIREAIHACRKIWASLPGAGYGQREVATDELVAVYKAAGGNVAGGVS